MIYEFGKMIVNLKKLLEMTTNNVSVLEERVKLLESQNKELIHELNNHTRFINNIIKNNDNMKNFDQGCYVIEEIGDL